MINICTKDVDFCANMWYNIKNILFCKDEVIKMAKAAKKDVQVSLETVLCGFLSTKQTDHINKILLPIIGGRISCCSIS